MRVRSQTHPGVSIKAMARSRFRLRWREQLADGTASYQSWTCTLRDIGEAERWAIESYRSLRTMGTFVRPVSSRVGCSRVAMDSGHVFAGVLRAPSHRAPGRLL